MVDQSDKGSEPEERAKTCADCGTTKTPLWRGGPAGPKSLCNACGIRSRKKRRALLGLNKASTEEKRSSTKKTNQSASNNWKLGDSLKRKLLAVGIEVAARRNLGEEEQAAVLLMALSRGSVWMLE